MTPDTKINNLSPTPQELAIKPDVYVVRNLASELALGDQADQQTTNKLIQELQHRIRLASVETDARQGEYFDKDILDQAENQGLEISGGVVPDGVKHLRSSLISNLRRELGLEKNDELPDEDKEILEDIFSLSGFDQDDERFASEATALGERIEEEYKKEDKDQGTTGKDQSTTGFLDGTDKDFDKKLDQLINSSGAPSAFGSIIGKLAEEIAIEKSSVDEQDIEKARNHQVRINRFYRLVNEAKNRFWPPSIPPQMNGESDEDYRKRNNSVIEAYSPKYPEFLSSLKASVSSARERRVKHFTQEFLVVQKKERMMRELMIKKRQEGEKHPKVSEKELFEYAEKRVFDDAEIQELEHLARKEVVSSIGTINKHNINQFIFDLVWSAPKKFELIEGPKPHPNMNVVRDGGRIKKLGSEIVARIKQNPESQLSAGTMALFNKIVKRHENSWWENGVDHSYHSGAYDIYSRQEVEAEMDYLRFYDEDHRKAVEAERVAVNSGNAIGQLQATLSTVNHEIALASELSVKFGEGLSNRQIEALLWDNKPQEYAYTKKTWEKRSDMFRFLLENEKREVAVSEFIKRHKRVESGDGIKHNRRIENLANPLADFVTATIVRGEIIRQLDELANS